MGCFLKSAHIRIAQHIKCTVAPIHTPSQCQIDVEPFSVIGSKYFHKKVVNEDSFTQCPGEGRQEEVVQQGSDKFAGSLNVANRQINAQSELWQIGSHFSCHNCVCVYYVCTILLDLDLYACIACMHGRSF